MLPTTPAGQTGSPRLPARTGTAETPRRSRARWAQSRPLANSRRRAATARAISASSAGKRSTGRPSSAASTATTAPGRIRSITGRLAEAAAGLVDRGEAGLEAVARRPQVEPPDPHPFRPGEADRLV